MEEKYTINMKPVTPSAVWDRKLCLSGLREGKGRKGKLTFLCCVPKESRHLSPYEFTF